MTKLNSDSNAIRFAQLRWLMPVLLLAPLSLAAKGCNSAEVGDDCPDDAKCSSGTAGSSSMAGSSSSAGTSSSAGSSSTPGMGGGMVGATCGGLQGAGCGADLFCQFDSDALCGAGDQTGTCQAKPELCGEIYAPVCGCDDMTYSNACEAAGAGVSVASEGACSGNPGGVACGTRGSPACPGGQFCNFPPSAQCGETDLPGTCAAMPEACDLSYVPVCGCDDMTYGNSCAAASAGVSVAHAGECGAPSGGTCGGFIGTPCDAGFFCDYPPEMNCGFADGSGNCKAIPDGCTADVMPVCGCDGMTYSNACTANMKGVSVNSPGACQ